MKVGLAAAAVAVSSFSLIGRKKNLANEKTARFITMLFFVGLDYCTRARIPSGERRMTSIAVPHLSIVLDICKHTLLLQALDEVK